MKKADGRTEKMIDKNIPEMMHAHQVSKIQFGRISPCSIRGRRRVRADEKKR